MKINRHPTPFKLPDQCLFTALLLAGVAVVVAGGLVMALWAVLPL